MKKMIQYIFPFIIFLSLYSVGLSENSCVTCHKEETPEIFNDFHMSVHFEKGILCQDCHGGDPTKQDMDEAMSESRGFKGVPTRKQIPRLCDRCHGDIEYMRKYNPSMRVDQYREYLTSVHGKQWKKGDPNVAVCTDCHTSHKILGADNPQSTIYPTNVPKTCAKCHSNKTLMKKYNLPTNQFDLYAQSVHGEALFKKNDISAPTCNDCHGNHGAIPPGIRNIAEVCGQCHVVQSNEFSAGPHKAIFNEIGEPGCVTCHSNHKINVLTDKNILDPKTSVCSNCHDDGDAGFEANKQIADAILYLSSNYERLQKKIDKAKMTGLSLDKPIYELQGLRDLLIKSRVVIHRMHPSGVLELKKKGEKIVKKVDDSIEKVITDYYNRKRGLYISLVFIVLVVIGLYFYMRERFQE